jgi:hypothetical protein
VIILALLLSSKPITYKLHAGVPLSICTSIKKVTSTHKL